MADSTRFKTLESNQNRFQETLEGLQKAQKEMEGRIEAHAQKLEDTVTNMEVKILGFMQRMTGKGKEPEILEQIPNLDKAPLLPTPMFRSKENQSQNPQYPDRSYQSSWQQAPRVELPMFYGERPREWIRRCQKYFMVYQVLEAQKMDIVEMFLEGKAEIWYHITKLAKGHISWEEFCRLVNKRFGKHGGQDDVEEFNNLQQRGSMNDYQEKFKELMLIRNPELTESYFSSSDTSGLKEEIKPMVRLRKTSFNHVDDDSEEESGDSEEVSILKMGEKVRAKGSTDMQLKYFGERMRVDFVDEGVWKKPEDSPAVARESQDLLEEFEEAASDDGIQSLALGAMDNSFLGCDVVVQVVKNFRHGIHGKGVYVTFDGGGKRGSSSVGPSTPRLLKLIPVDSHMAGATNKFHGGHFSWVTESGKQERHLVMGKFSVIWNFQQVKNNAHHCYQNQQGLKSYYTIAIMVLMALFTTFITTPLVIAGYKPAKKTKKVDYKHRIRERKNPTTEIRILACFHSARNIPSLINLLEASRGTEKKESLCVYSMHLMELSERSSAIQMVQKARRNRLPFWNKGQSEANHVIVAFEAFYQLRKVSVKPMTSISSFSYMHEDSTAERKRAAIIILPLHKHQRLEGSLETTKLEYCDVNIKVLEQASFSMAIFVDHGLGGNALVSSRNVSYHTVVLFFGGSDDRKALTYGVRMAEHPGISLTVVHFSVFTESGEEKVQIEAKNGQGSCNDISADEEAIAIFKDRFSKDDSVKYEERAFVSLEEAIAALRGYSRCNLFLVGRKPDGELALALNGRSDQNPELGPVGSLRINSESFSTIASVLVIQQYQNKAPSDDQCSVRKNVDDLHLLYCVNEILQPWQARKALRALKGPGNLSIQKFRLRCDQIDSKCLYNWICAMKLESLIWKYGDVECGSGVHLLFLSQTLSSFISIQSHIKTIKQSGDYFLVAQSLRTRMMLIGRDL